MKYSEDGMPVMETERDIPEYVHEFYNTTGLDYDDVEGICYAGYELGKREVLQQYSPINELLRTLAMITLEEGFDIPPLEHEGEKYMQVATAVIEVPGVREQLVHYISRVSDGILEGPGEVIILEDLTEDQQNSIEQVYEDHFVREA